MVVDGSDIEVRSPLKRPTLLVGVLNWPKWGYCTQYTNVLMGYCARSFFFSLFFMCFNEVHYVFRLSNLDT